MRYKGHDYKTIRELGEIVAEIANTQDKEVAKDFMFQYALDTWGERECPFLEAEDICRKNVGYVAGYYDPETMGKIFSTFCVEHPVFGTRTDVTPEEALKAGIKLGEEMKRELEAGGSEKEGEVSAEG